MKLSRNRADLCLSSSAPPQENEEDVALFDAEEDAGQRLSKKTNIKSVRSVNKDRAVFQTFSAMVMLMVMLMFMFAGIQWRASSTCSSGLAPF